jgi:hypothetical protein
VAALLGLALQLRNLQSLVEIGVDKNTTVVFPAPLMSTIGELGAFLAREAASAATPAPAPTTTAPAPATAPAAEAPATEAAFNTDYDGTDSDGPPAARP